MMSNVSFGNAPKTTVPNVLNTQVEMAIGELQMGNNEGMRGMPQKNFQASNLVLTALANKDTLEFSERTAKFLDTLA